LADLSNGGSMTAHVGSGLAALGLSGSGTYPGATIPKRRLGATGPEITVVGLGSWAIGGPYEFGWGPVDDNQSISAIRHGIESGINWVDTAPVYGKGHSEEVVGRALEPFKAGEEVFVFTKCGRNYYGASEKISSDLRPETIRWECEQSLRRLKVERIDLLQFHWPDPDTGTAIEDSWGAMGELIDEGKVRWGGVSNFDVPLLERCNAIRHVESLQPPLNLINRAARNDIIPWCEDHGVGVIVYAPMASGLLTGKFDRNRVEQLAADDWRRRSANFNEPRLSQNLALVQQLELIADDLQIGLPVLSVAWTLSIPGVTGAIVGARSPEQVDGWLPAARARLPQQTLFGIQQAIDLTGAGDERSVLSPLSARRD
jgi:aryl-alcohol dehydrogenase-like predicted oxidoreductase